MPDKLLPGATIGILGGGQLGRMLAIAAAELGYRTYVFTPEQDTPASQVVNATLCADYNDMDALQRFAAAVDVVTYEFENIPHAPVADLAKQVAVFPSPDILATSQHRVREKEAVTDLGIGTAPFMAVNDASGLQKAAAALGLPAVLKTARMGYDGKGQMLLSKESNLQDCWTQLATDEAILEGFVPFRMEISVIVARNAQGQIACYPPVQNIHKHHILAETIAPAPIAPVLAERAEWVARHIAESLGLVGLMAVEMFVTDTDEVLVNELAPRPHNSGHWTIDACITSQFEQTIRAICGLPLGSTAPLRDARMLNLIGDDVNDCERYLAQPNAKLHLYGKREARKGRKMGHVTLLET